MSTATPRPHHHHHLSELLKETPSWFPNFLSCHFLMFTLHMATRVIYKWVMSFPHTKNKILDLNPGLWPSCWSSCPCALYLTHSGLPSISNIFSFLILSFLSEKSNVIEQFMMSSWDTMGTAFSFVSQHPISSLP